MYHKHLEKCRLFSAKYCPLLESYWSCEKFRLVHAEVWSSSIQSCWKYSEEVHWGFYILCIANFSVTGDIFIGTCTDDLVNMPTAESQPRAVKMIQDALDQLSSWIIIFFFSLIYLKQLPFFLRFFAVIHQCCR